MHTRSNDLVASPVLAVTVPDVSHLPPHHPPGDLHPARGAGPRSKGLPYPPPAQVLPGECGPPRPLPDPLTRELPVVGRPPEPQPALTGAPRIPPVRHLPRREVVLEHSRRGARTLSALIAITALAGASYIGWDQWGGDLYSERAQSAMSSELATAAPVVTEPAPSAAPAAPTPPTPVILASTLKVADGTPMGRIMIDKIGVNAAFVYGTGLAQLAKGPSLWKWGVAPGQPGNAMIAAHRTTYGAWFRHLDSLVPGDLIRIQIPGQPDSVFAVRETRIVDASDVGVTGQTPGVRLTLSACHPLGSAAQRIVVQAELVQGANLQYAIHDGPWSFQS